MWEYNGGYAERLRRLCAEKARDRLVPDGSDKHRHSQYCQWNPTFVVDTDSRRWLIESTGMKMVNQVKRSKIA